LRQIVNTLQRKQKKKPDFLTRMSILQYDCQHSGSSGCQREEGRANVSEAAKEAHISPVEGEKVVASMERDETSMTTNSHKEIARVLKNSERTNLRVSSIAQWIGCAIIEGRLHPGDDLNTVDLSKQFQTSRTPVKEALLLLEKEGLVTVPPYRRPYVARVSLEEIREIYQVRTNLLMLVAELIVRTASDEAIASLRARLPFIREMAVSNNIDGVFWASVAFRNREADICGNRQVKRILDSLGLRTLQLRHLSMSLAPGEKRISFREHLVAAYEERNAPLAIELTRSMVLRSLAIIEQSGWIGFQTTKEDDHVA
jgi:DNA-binding GntR family transcriptional regulator